MAWDPRIEPWLGRYPALRAIGHTPLVPVDVFREELPDVEVFAKMECLNPGGSLKDRPVLRMVVGALADRRLGSRAATTTPLGLREAASRPRGSGRSRD